MPSNSFMQERLTFKLWYYNEKSHSIIFPFSVTTKDEQHRLYNFRNAIRAYCRRNGIKIHTKIIQHSKTDKKKYLSISRTDCRGKYTIHYICEHGGEDFL